MGSFQNGGGGHRSLDNSKGCLLKKIICIASVWGGGHSCLRRSGVSDSPEDLGTRLSAVESSLQLQEVWFGFSNLMKLQIQTCEIGREKQ